MLTLAWSEFGRRPRENGSGTDHGAAFLIVPNAASFTAPTLLKP